MPLPEKSKAIFGEGGGKGKKIRKKTSLKQRERAVRDGALHPVGVQQKKVF